MNEELFWLIGKSPRSDLGGLIPSKRSIIPFSTLFLHDRNPRVLSISSELAKRFAEGIEKLVENTLGHRRKKTRRLTARMSKAVGLAGGTTFAKISMGKPSVSDGCTATA
ncbi:hypothetical protein B296_00030418 [Ensete ventricosum]|uniref:Uncharacterized protein n=1 Tax=Ensete ventricosum TaxID=4639 RepID=A0A426X1K9_ENSVE|nr:hypothetical protein B296_00030418 [Ensete ventricosum]